MHLKILFITPSKGTKTFSMFRFDVRTSIIKLYVRSSKYTNCFFSLCIVNPIGPCAYFLLKLAPQGILRKIPIISMWSLNYRNIKPSFLSILSNIDFYILYAKHKERNFEKFDRFLFHKRK